MKKVMFAAAFAALVSAGQAGAQQFPARPVTMVIPFAAGGPQDTIGRVIAQRMSELLGQQVVVENVGGAGGMTGSSASPMRSLTATRWCSAASARSAKPDALHSGPIQCGDRFHAGGLPRDNSDRADHPAGPAGEQSQGLCCLRQPIRAKCNSVPRAPAPPRISPRRLNTAMARR